MTVGLKQRSVVTEIGPGGLLHSFFSTIALRLENGQWGSRFPTIMNDLYGGSIQSSQHDDALRELKQIQQELGMIGPDEVVWEIDDPDVPPPWGTEVGPHVTSMAHYYVTVTGRNLIGEIFDNLASLKEFGGTLDLVSYNGAPGI